MDYRGKTLTFQQYNTHEAMKWTIVDEERGSPINLTAATITCIIQSVDETSTIIDQEVEYIDRVIGEIKLVPTTGDFDTPGLYKVQLKIVYGDTTIAYIQDMFISIISVLS